MDMATVAVYLILAVGVAALADIMGMRAFNWFLAALIFSPALAGLALGVRRLVQRFSKNPERFNVRRSKLRQGIAGSIVAASVISFAISLYAYFSTDFIAGQMPACDSKGVAALLTQAVNGSPAGKLQGVTVFDVTGALQIPAIDDKQRCQATLFTNAGKRQATFTLEWMSAAKDKLWLQVEPGWSSRWI